MATHTRSITVFSDGNYSVASQQRFVGLRCLHAREGGFVNPTSMPNVRRAKDIQAVKFLGNLQQLAWDVMRAKNHTITEGQFENIFGSGTAFCNGHGVETGDPKLMDGLICAGMWLPDTVGRDSDYFICYPGVHAIDANKPLPTPQQVIDNRWYFVANTGQGPLGAYNFPQGNGGPVCIIYALVEPARYQRAWFEPWDREYLPDPLKYYKV